MPTGKQDWVYANNLLARVLFAGSIDERLPGYCLYPVLAAAILWAPRRLCKNDQGQFCAKQEAEGYTQLKKAFVAMLSHEICIPLHSILQEANLPCF